jgi:hypothetical protein
MERRKGREAGVRGGHSRLSRSDWTPWLTKPERERETGSGMERENDRGRVWSDGERDIERGWVEG